MKAAWFRQVTKNDKTELEAFYSVYEARPLFEQIGAVGSDITEIPDWIGEADPAG
jgi:hypothetical protein